VARSIEYALQSGANVLQQIVSGLDGGQVRHSRTNPAPAPRLDSSITRWIVNLRNDLQTSRRRKRLRKSDVKANVMDAPLLAALRHMLRRNQNNDSSGGAKSAIHIKKAQSRRIALRFRQRRRFWGSASSTEARHSFIMRAACDNFKKYCCNAEYII
jgi:hypothetical protein